jgi:hypothetical protein
MAKSTNTGGYPPPATHVAITSSATYGSGTAPLAGGGGTDGSRVSHGPA